MAKKTISTWLLQLKNTGLPDFSHADANARYKLAFLYKVFSFAGLVSLLMSIVRMETHPLLAIIDLGIGLLALCLLTLLRIKQQWVEQIATIAIVACFVQFLTIYFYAVENSSRSALLLLVLASAFYLKGKRAGYLCLGLILALVLGNHLLHIQNKASSNVDILTLCCYLLAQFFIIHNYENLNESQTRHLQQLNDELETQVKKRTNELASANRALLIEKQNLRLLSTTDHLTGIFNRHYLEEVFKAEHHSISLHQHTLILLDIDHFKHINDVYGHLTGDAILKTVSSLLQQSVRANDCLIRWGGDEFIIFAPRTNPNQAIHIAEKIRHHIGGMTTTLKEPLTVSIGIAGSHANDTLETLLLRADKALYDAKASGRNQSHTHQKAS